MEEAKAHRYGNVSNGSNGFRGIVSGLRRNVLGGDKNGEEESGFLTLRTVRTSEIVARFNPQNGQLVSLQNSGVEFMSGGGKPDALKTEQEKASWPNSEITMFPIIGSPISKEVDGVKTSVITVNGVDYPMPQHGVSRYLPYVIDTSHQKSWNEVVFSQEYVAGTELETPKGKAAFPFSFSLKKKFDLHWSTLVVTFEIENKSASAMPFALGWHPAFRTAGGGSYIEVRAGDSPISGYRAPERYSLAEVKEASKTGALVLEGARFVSYLSDIGKVSVLSNMGNMQVWSPEGQDLICLEPMTATSFSRYKHSGELSKAPYFKMLEPGKEVEFTVSVTTQLPPRRTKNLVWSVVRNPA